MIDVIAGANYTDANNAYVSAGIFNPNNSTDEALPAALASVGTSNFLLIINADVDGFGSFGIGGVAGNRVKFGDGIISQTQMVGAGGTVGALDNFADTSGAYKTHMIWYDGTDAHSKIDAGATNDTTGDPGAITLLDLMTLGSIPKMTGAAFFVFDGDVPSAIEIAGRFMGQCWENLDKCLYPSGVAEWGAWS